MIHCWSHSLLLQNCFSTKYQSLQPLVVGSLLHQLRGRVVGHLDPGDVGAGLEVDAVHLAVLPLQLVAHVIGHVAQVPDHGAHLDTRVSCF